MIAHQYKDHLRKLEIIWLYCEKSLGNAMDMKKCFTFSLESHSKQAGDERHLTQAVSFFHAMHLPFLIMFIAS